MRTDGHDESNTRFFAILRTRLKIHTRTTYVQILIVSPSDFIFVIKNSPVILWAYITILLVSTLFTSRYEHVNIPKRRYLEYRTTQRISNACFCGFFVVTHILLCFSDTVLRTTNNIIHYSTPHVSATYGHHRVLYKRKKEEYTGYTGRHNKTRTFEKPNKN